MLNLRNPEAFRNKPELLPLFSIIYPFCL